MDNIKPWQIILFVAAIGVLGFSVWKFGFSSSVPVTDGYLGVDINTGELYNIQKGKARGVPFPVKHPESGDRVIYPVEQVEGLLYEIPAGFESYLTSDVRENSKLRSSSMQIEVVGEDPIRYVLMP